MGDCGLIDNTHLPTMMFAEHNRGSYHSNTKSGTTIPRGGGLKLSPDQVAKAVEKEFEDLDYISERKLKKLTNEDNLENVKRLELSIDTREHSLSRLGHLTPNLFEFKLYD